MLVVFLPPLLYSAAFFASLRELKYDLRSILLHEVMHRAEHERDLEDERLEI